VYLIFHWTSPCVAVWGDIYLFILVFSGPGHILLFVDVLIYFLFIRPGNFLLFGDIFLYLIILKAPPSFAVSRYIVTFVHPPDQSMSVWYSI